VAVRCRSGRCDLIASFFPLVYRLTPAPSAPQKSKLVRAAPQLGSKSRARVPARSVSSMPRRLICPLATKKVRNAGNTILDFGRRGGGLSYCPRTPGPQPMALPLHDLSGRDGTRLIAMEADNDAGAVTQCPQLFAESLINPLSLMFCNHDIKLDGRHLQKGGKRQWPA
jgi:hypothetical protein